ncbi:metal ABC transporter solute-binding protein, Zn/Mn family [Kocuria sabuli]|uniref:metal ABC transporter solute-binding protein, Zn/Mn family n=1 Tax=Kocuria sabuli TaxID=3071448 RepID=UPI0034D79463
MAASFYPLQYVTERVGGDLVTVQSLTPAGADAHDVELSPAAVAELGEVEAVVYLSGFQAAVDDAVAQAAPEYVVDAAGPADLMAASGHDHEHEGHDHEHEAHDHGGMDPHFWLDPVRLAAVAEEVARQFGEADPDNAGTYEANAAQLAGELTDLDEEFRTGLESCDQRTVVAGHEAYGYLTDKYGLEQVGIAGLDPEAEPSPARLAEVGNVIQDQGVTTVFTESQLNPKVARTLADDHGITSAVLDPVESQVEQDKDYQQVMRENLEALRAGLGC